MITLHFNETTVTLVNNSRYTSTTKISDQTMATLSQIAVATSVVVVLVIVGLSSTEASRVWECRNQYSCQSGQMCVTKNNNVCTPGMKQCYCRSGCYANRTFIPLNRYLRTSKHQVCYCARDKMGMNDIFCYYRKH
ncbi:hypothetical protein ScPMuIL_004172 [Solemya velum]